MYKNKKIIAIIPARSGSKGLSDKNIKNLNGKPLIAYTIDAAIKSNVFDEIMVSTNSEEYAKIARQFGANVPFLRSEENSSDGASSLSVCEEVLNKFNKKLNLTFDIVIILQPTSPLRTAQNIKEALNLFIEKEADVVVGVAKTAHPIEWCNSLDESLSFYNFVKKEYANKRRQELKPSYLINGAIYIVKTELMNNGLDLYCKNSYAYVMDEKKSIDIDDELDFIIAQNLLNERIFARE